MSSVFRSVLYSGLAITTVWTASLGSMAAQTTPIGNEFQVNGYTTGAQTFPEVDVDAAGNALVLWRGATSRVREVSVDGVLGASYDVGFQGVDIARSGSGEFVVLYDTFRSLEARTFDSQGNPHSPLVQLSASDTRDPRVGMSDAGDFVVVWATVPGGEDPREIFAQRLDFDGTPLGETFQVNNYTTGAQVEPDVEMMPNGQFAVVWTSSGSPETDTVGSSIQARVFSSDGQPSSPQFQVNTIEESGQTQPTVSWLADGNLAFAWRDFSTGSISDITMQRAQADGTRLGQSTVINTYNSGSQRFASVAGLDDGTFVVAWQSTGSLEDDSMGYSIQGRAFDSAGVPLDNQYQINTTTPQSQIRPALVAQPSGRSLVVWQSQRSAGDDTDAASIQGQRFGPFTPEVFVDGFESGNTASWSDAQP